MGKVKRAIGRALGYAPHAEMLGKPCWMRDRRDGRVRKFRVVAVSRKGAINVRRWDDESGRGAFWVPSGQVERSVRFEEGRRAGEEGSGRWSGVEL